MDIKSPKWMLRFLSLANEISTWSKDDSTKVGAVIIDKNGEPISWGFNGFPMGVNDDVPERKHRPLKYHYTQHAERNALDFAPRPNLETCVLVVTHFPCTECAKSIIQRKIKTIITPSIDINSEFYTRWYENIQITKQMFSESGVDVLFIGEKNE